MLVSMTDTSRIPADPEYLSLLGRAFYNFTYLEWIVVCTIAKLSSDGFSSVPRRQPASKIAKALISNIAATEPPLPNDLRRGLVKLHQSYLEAIAHRNKLLHAHPYSTESGDQRLSGGGVDWPSELVEEAAQFFEDVAIQANHIFHGALKAARP